MLWSMEEILDPTVKNNLRTYDNIRKIVTGQGNDVHWMFTRLYLFHKILHNTYIHCNTFK